jgi:hypothetical protein
MKQVTINVTDNKYSFLLELLKSMDFVSIANENDWFENLKEEEKKLIQQGVNDLDNNNTFSHEEVIQFSKKRISELRNSK